MTTMSYDPECERLAVYFLSAGGEWFPPEQMRELSQHIQGAIEDWLRTHDVPRDGWCVYVAPEAREITRPVVRSLTTAAASRPASHGFVTQRQPSG